MVVKANHAANKHMFYPNSNYMFFTQSQRLHVIKTRELHHFTSYCMLNIAVTGQLKKPSGDSQWTEPFRGFIASSQSLLRREQLFTICAYTTLIEASNEGNTANTTLCYGFLCGMYQYDFYLR